MKIIIMNRNIKKYVKYIYKNIYYNYYKIFLIKNEI